MFNLIIKRSAILPVLLPIFIWGQSLRINEVVSSNQNGLRDEDGDTPDWVEIYNASTNTVDLAGYGLSDDTSEPYKWIFASGSVEPGAYELVYASDKDRHASEVSWEMIIEEGAEWQYYVGYSEPPASWNTTSFDDFQWTSGNSGIGYGDNDDNTIISPTLSLYMRHEFFLSNPAEFLQLLFHIDYDDGYIAYLNGVEFSRKNMGLGSPATYNTVATTYTEPVLPYGGSLPPTLIPAELVLDGRNVLAIQVHNSGLSSSDLTALPFLSIEKPLSNSSNLPSFLEIPPPVKNHTNFKISSSGETLVLSSQMGDLHDTLALPPLPSDISYGSFPDGGSDYYYFTNPTPGLENENGFPILAQAPVLNPPPGFYQNTISVDPGDIPSGLSYTFTLDGTEPDLTSPEFSSPLSVSQTTVLRVLVSSLDGLNQHSSSYSYFINESPQLPVMSIIFEPDDFFAYDSGMYANGPRASGDFPHFGANFWEDWERQIHLEYFANAQDLSYAANAGAKIFGGWSRGFPQKSLALYARGRYGDSEFNFSFFENLDIDSFEALVLRNSGNDWEFTGFRDGLLTGLINGRHIEHQAFQPVEVYFNGEYWGIQNLREKVNEHFIAGHFNISAEEIDILEADNVGIYPDDWHAIQGSNSSYLELVDFIESHDFTESSEYEYVQERVDIQNFIDYQLAQIYFDNRDWPGNNIKFWRDQKAGGKWRWILYDTDFGFGIWNPLAYQDNTLLFATASNGPAWPNPPWSTLMLRKLLNNQQFRKNFILTACDLFNDPFSPQKVIADLTQLKNYLENAMPNHFQRWGQNNMENWNSRVYDLSRFAQFRPVHMRNHIKNYFGLGTIAQLTSEIEPEGAGKIRVHTLHPESYPWSGLYYSGLAIDLEAIPEPGYNFSHWEDINSSERHVSLILSSDSTITAHYVKSTGNFESIVINEINYNSPDAQDSGDWLELFNAGDEEINLNGWSMSDANDDNSFGIGNIYIGAGEYLTLCHDSSLFRNIHGDEPIIRGNFDFNLSNGGELVRLFDHQGTLIDSVRYDDKIPWPIEPDGDGPTLELLNPDLDNGRSDSWASSDGFGTPGRENSRSTVTVKPQLASQPNRLRVTHAYPNPFNAQVTLSYELAGPGTAFIQVYDIRGRLMLSRTEPDKSAGLYNFIWNGKQGSGEDCASGVYIVRITQDRDFADSKILLLR